MGFLGEFFSALWNDISKICGEKVTLGDNPITTLMSLNELLGETIPVEQILKERIIPCKKRTMNS